MELSPKGRWIEDVEGNPEDIMSRGDKIETLGQQMLDCADTLETIKNSALSDGNQQGKAIEKLKESIGESYDVLREAGELYEPVGPIIRSYGSSLSIIQPSLNGHVSDCESKWATYMSLPGDAEGSTTPEAGGGFLGMGGHDADSPEAKQEAEENAAKKEAYDDWLESAKAFDINYDSWEQAFDDAANGVEDEMAGKIKDSFWSTLTDWLEIAALIIGVAALIIGGPIIAAIALAVAAALLITTYMSYKNGERSGTDVAFAAIGVFPFGKVAKFSGMSKVVQALRGGGTGTLSNLGRVGSEINSFKGLKGMTKYVSSVRNNGLMNTIKQGDGLIGVFNNKGSGPMLTKLFTGSERGFTETYRFHKSLFEGPGAAMAQLRNGNLTKTLAGIDFASAGLAHNLDNIKFLSMMTPGLDFEIKIDGPVGRMVG